MFLKMFNSKILYFILVLTFISCTNNKIDFKNGTFKIEVNDSITSYIERNENYQLEYLPNNEEKELFKIRWVSDKRYLIEDIDKKDSLSFFPLVIIIDSISKNSYYQTSYIEGIDLTFKSKIEKIDDNVSDEFKIMILKLD
jgi:hypothetical protein